MKEMLNLIEKAKAYKIDVSAEDISPDFIKILKLFQEQLEIAHTHFVFVFDVYNTLANAMITPASEQLHAQYVSDRLKVMQDPATSEVKLDYIALGTSWIKGLRRKGDLDWHPQHKEINELIISMRRFFKEHNILFIEGEDDYVANEVKRLKQDNPDARGLVLAGETAINDIDKSLTEEARKNTFLAGVDNKHLTIDSYHRIMQMYKVLIMLSMANSLDDIHKDEIKAWQEQLGFKLHQEGRITRIIFIPPAEPMNYEKLREIYELQIFA